MDNMKTRLLYVYEERVPLKLRELVLSYIPKNQFEIDSMTYTLSDDEIIEKMKWAEVVLFAPGRFLSDKVLSNAKHVKLMQLWSSGYDKFNIADCKKYGIPVANNGGANACSVAEHALLLMLAVYKWLPQSHERTITGNWTGNSHGLDMFLINQKKVGIIGFGNIGKQVARKISGFDPIIYYYDINRAPQEIEKQYGVEYKNFDELISESDIITLHLHSNEATKNIISEKVIANMKSNAIIINVSRAQLIDQEALFHALKDHKIAGAGLDVYVSEPTTGKEAILGLPNVVATPHMAGSTFDTYEMVMRRAIQNFRNAVDNKPINWIVS